MVPNCSIETALPTFIRHIRTQIRGTEGDWAEPVSQSVGQFVSLILSKQYLYYPSIDEDYLMEHIFFPFFLAIDCQRFSEHKFQASVI